MATKEQNFELWAGDYREIIFVVEDVEALDGASVKWFMAASAKNEPLLQKESPEGIDVDGNKFTVMLLPEDTETINPGGYYHEAVITDVEGHVVTVAIGKAVVNPSLKNKGVSEIG